MKNIRTLDMGEGQPLILLNGMFQSVDSWTAVAEPLSRFHRIIAFDMPNQGEAPTDPTYDSLSRYADFVLDMMQEIGVDPQETVVFGYSFGAGVARTMVGEKQIPLRGLILGGALSRDVSPYLLMRMENWLRLFDEGSFDLWAKTMLIDIFSPGWISANTHAFDDIYAMFTTNYAWRPQAARALVAAVAASLRKHGVTAEVFDCSIHVIGAEDDAMAPFRHVQRFSQAIGARHLHVLPGGHTLRIEALPQLIAALDAATSDMSGEKQLMA